MSVSQSPTSRYGCKITTVDPSQGLVEAVLKGSLRNISIYSIPTAFAWPVVGESWMVTQMNGSWYLEGRFSDTNSFKNVNPGDAVITSPTGIIHVLTDGQGEDYIIDSAGQVGPEGPAGPQGEPGATGSTGPAGPTGPAGGSFVWEQGSPSANWMITHNLGIYPVAIVHDSAGDKVEGEETYVDENHMQIAFSAPFSGTAYLN